MLPISGQSILNILRSNKEGVVDKSKQYVFAGRERHSSSRYQNHGYPQRAVRSHDYLLIWNMKPNRWPAGAPQRIMPDNENELFPMHGIDENGVHHSEWAFTDIDAARTKSYIIEKWEDENVWPYFEMAHGKRPEYELYDVKEDPYNLVNLAGNPEYAEIEGKLKERLLDELTRTQDPRIVGPYNEIFDSYIRYGRMRNFPKPN